MLAVMLVLLWLFFLGAAGSFYVEFFALALLYPDGMFHPTLHLGFAIFGFPIFCGLALPVAVFVVEDWRSSKRSHQIWRKRQIAAKRALVLSAGGEWPPTDFQWLRDL